MIRSISRELFPIGIPKYTGEIKMLPFDLADLKSIPAKFKKTVQKMISMLPIKSGIAYLTVDGKLVKFGETQRRGGPHIDGNYIPEENSWGGGGGNGWKVGQGGREISSASHKLSYQNPLGGMIIASSFPACVGWVGQFNGDPGIGGDCSHIPERGEGFLLRPYKAYYGNSQFIHESISLPVTTHRTMIRITLPIDYPVI